ncbi:hypothetical protein [Vibrio rotiferianus]|uniref:hypothetical protein n=1 Tax=Vibrio rotiferianus TaxID=190895 RepID=UPI00039F25D2|nr:hypothetical protein [Vibrio rotiferianus]PIB15366.1 hypothetical protein B853_15313 [Vibrio rotiferianus CAIM 577 = LMG 21460]
MDEVAIVNAINGLKSNPIKDYIFPAASVIFTTSLGAWAVLYSVNIQERNRIQIQNIDALNEAIIQASEALDELKMIKRNYFSRLSDCPYERLAVIPEVILHPTTIDLKVSSLSFIVPAKGVLKKSRWRNLAYIKALFKQFKGLQDLWLLRNKKYSELRTKFKNARNLDKEGIQSVLDEYEIIEIADLTEQCLHHTDDLILEISCFLIGFPEANKSIFHKKVLKKYRKTLLIELSEDNLVTFVPELNIVEMAELMGMEHEDASTRYQRIFNR